MTKNSRECQKFLILMKISLPRAKLQNMSFLHKCNETNQNTKILYVHKIEFFSCTLLVYWKSRVKEKLPILQKIKKKFTLWWLLDCSTRKLIPPRPKHVHYSCTIYLRYSLILYFLLKVLFNLVLYLLKVFFCL